jgi:hypothetical protein
MQRQTRSWTPRAIVLAGVVATASVQAQQVPAPVQDSAPVLKLANFSVGQRLADAALEAEPAARAAQVVLRKWYGAPTLVVSAAAKAVGETSSVSKLPGWANSVAPTLRAEQIAWLYKRPTHTMAFVLRGATVDAVIVAGQQGNKAPVLQARGLENLKAGLGDVRLGDDLRRVLLRWGYPNNIFRFPSMTAPLSAAPKVVPEESPSIYEMRYDKAGVVFTVRNNRVARIYIFNAGAAKETAK